MLSKKRRKKSIKNNKSSICSTIAKELEEKGIVIKGGQNDLDNEEIKRGEKLKRRLGRTRVLIYNKSCSVRKINIQSQPLIIDQTQEKIEETPF